MKKMLVFVAAALLAPIGIANAVDPPEQKEGLWSSRSQTIDNPGNDKSEQTSTICRNHAYDQYVLSIAKGVKGCTTGGESTQGGKHSVEMKRNRSILAGNQQRASHNLLKHGRPPLSP